MVVNIIGRGRGWEDAPRDELSWGITLINLQRPVDLVIDMNVYDDGRWGETERLGAVASKALAWKNNIPYICLDNYPIDDILNHFKVDYFNSTVDYAIALAIYNKYTQIKCWGVNMANNTEYAEQKGGVEFWLGYAMGTGIDIQVNGSYSRILKTKDGKMYGYDLPQKGLL